MHVFLAVPEIVPVSLPEQTPQLCSCLMPCDVAGCFLVVVSFSAHCDMWRRRETCGAAPLLIKYASTITTMTTRATVGVLLLVVLHCFPLEVCIALSGLVRPGASDCSMIAPQVVVSKGILPSERLALLLLGVLHTSLLASWTFLLGVHNWSSHMPSRPELQKS